jgi:hypothetical protein
MSEYHSQVQVTDTHHKPAGILFTLVLVLIGFVLTAVLINRSVTQTYWHPEIDDYSRRSAALLQNGSQIDTVFVGSSHLLHGISPRTFDKGTTQLGSATNSYNLAQFGAVYPLQRHTLLQIQTMNSDNLRYVVFEPMLFMIPSAPPLSEAYANIFSTRNRYLYNLDAMQDTLRMRMASNRSLAKRLAGAGLIGFAWLVHESNLGVLRDLWLPVENSTISIDEAWENRGYFASPKEQQPGLDFSNPPNPNDDYRTYSETELQGLDSLLEIIRATGAKPILLYPPVRKAVGRQTALVEATRARYPELIVLDYTYNADPLALYDDKAYWRDTSHLNKRGAEVFSTILAKDWHARLSALTDAP